MVNLDCGMGVRTLMLRSEDLLIINENNIILKTYRLN